MLRKLRIRLPWLQESSLLRSRAGSLLGNLGGSLTGSFPYSSARTRAVNIVRLMWLRSERVLFGLVAAFALLLFAGCQADSRPQAPQVTCYAATYGQGIYRSTNGGKSWFPLKEERRDIYYYHKRLFTNPFEKSELYVATTGKGLSKIELKKDESRLSIARFDGMTIRAIAFVRSHTSSETKEEILVGTSNEGILKSSDNGKSWQPFNNGLYFQEVNMLYAQGGNLFAGTLRDLFKWSSSREKWEACSVGMKNKNIISMGGDKQKKIMLAGCGGFQEEKGFFETVPCLYRSMDEGGSWVVSDKGLPDGALVYSVAVNPTKPERVFLGTSDGVYRSLDSGISWEKLKNGLPRDLRVLEIKMARAPDGTHIVYAVVGPEGIFMAMDIEDPQWVNCSYGIAWTGITSIVAAQD